MSRTLFLLFAVVAIFSASSYGDECGPNEEFKSCGSACEPSCVKPRIDFCTYDCKIGCQCKGGFLRNTDGACVAPGNC